MKYELALVLKPLNNEDIKERVMPKIEKTLKELDGSVKLKQTLGKRMLAYPINKFKEGVYSFYRLELPTTKLTEFKKTLTLTGEVLRYLIIKESEL